MNKKIRLVALLSLIYCISISFYYIDELRNHLSYLSCYHGILYNFTHDSFEWIYDIEGTNKAHEDAIKRGNDFSYNYVFLKPVFNIAGYLKLIFLPLSMVWVLLLLVVSFWRRNGKCIKDFVSPMFYSMDPILRFSVLILIVGCPLSIYLLGCPYEFNILVFILIFIFMPAVWFIVKKTLVDLIYLIAKAINDAKK